MTIGSQSAPTTFIRSDDPAIYRVRPVLMKRARDLGWLAVTPKGWPLSVGVDGKTALDARRKFAAAMLRWASY